MKKSYFKPDIVFESFQLCSSIANAICEEKIGPHTGTCGIELGGNDYGSVTVFTSDMVGVCNFWESDTDGIDSAMWNGICYHVPMAGLNCFNS